MDQHAQHFWNGCAQRELRLQRCSGCGHVQFFPRDHCVQCNSERLTWQTARGSGTIYSITRIERAPNDAFRAIAPYCIALVDLDEGVRIMAHASPALAIGDRAHVNFFSIDNLFLPRFEPL